jgi:hypothetical protein
MAKNRFAPFVRGGPSAIYQPAAIEWPQTTPPGANYPQFEQGQVAIVPPNNQIWMFVNTVKGSGAAIWIPLSGGATPALFTFLGGAGTTGFPVVPNSMGQITLSSNAGTIAITGSTNAINYDIVGGAPIQRLETDDGLYETPTGSPGTIIIHGTNGITTSQGTTSQVNINGPTNGILSTLTGDDGTVVTPSGNNINLFGNVVANATHAKAVFVESPVAHEERIDIQVASAIASSNIANVGLAAFNLADFSVDANGFVTLAAGAGAAFSIINVQTFTSSGTYTPTANTKYVIIECVGGGGGSGGCTAGTATTVCAASGGAGGGYARKFASAATIGVSQVVTIGAGGIAGSTTMATLGGTGGTTSVGAICVAIGGPGGYNPGSFTFVAVNGFTGSVVGAVGDFVVAGQSGGNSVGNGVGASTQQCCGGMGGNSMYGSGGQSVSGAGISNGQVGVLYGGGASGAIAGLNQAAIVGAVGAPGIVIITEFI